MKSNTSNKRLFSQLLGLLGMALLIGGCGSTELVKPSLTNLMSIEDFKKI